MPTATRALVVVPPLLKYSAGPLLGPALLVAAARASGHEADVLDLSIRWIRAHLPPRVAAPPSTVVGDHDKPGSLLSDLQRDVFVPLLRAHLSEVEHLDGADPHLTLTCSHGALETAAERLAASAHGAWIRSVLAERERPHVLGVSVLFSGQVLFGLAVGIVARALWPGVRVVWGGPHVTALQDRIVRDPRFGRMVDAFIFGYAECTFVELLDAVARRAPLPPGCVRAGQGELHRAADDPGHAPVFQDLELYGLPRLTLPAQASRGCSYGRCGFCTYPTIEGTYRAIDEAIVEPVVQLGFDRGATVAFKDSLIVPQRLTALAARIRARVRWSACTKLSPALDEASLRRLAVGGCDTLEIGLETIDIESQRLIGKRQSVALFKRTLDAARDAGVGLVINYITGFPGTTPAEEQGELAWVEDEVKLRRPRLRAVIEHNEFQLERLSAMGRNPKTFGLRVTGEWPWSSMLSWEGEGRGAPRTRLPVR
ncbi:B12-binding domain-containing radical SAM protein [Sorangium sp. So ce117]|uniref:B12-binding domain-containing radical SAM protein n=1 Tax=Sorangium sp. So ce117 TaxID=3133277 RepID=UPI003F6418FE